MSVPSVPVAAAATASTDTGIDELTRLVVRGGVMVLTGAGLSTESGIPDYRGPDGTRRVTPMQYAEFIGSSEARRRYWARSYIGWQRFNRAAPNSGHRAVATLQRAGLLDAVVTQNVDGLHQAAGAVDVTELHGNLDRVVCLTCGDARRARIAARAAGRGQPRLRRPGPRRRSRRVPGHQPDPPGRRHRPRRRGDRPLPPAGVPRLRLRHPQARRRLLRRVGAQGHGRSVLRHRRRRSTRCSSSALRWP